MRPSAKSNEAGMAIITALLVLMLASGLMAGMFAALLADQKSHATDRDQSMAYAAAHAGLEKLTSNLGALFDTDFSPSAADISLIDDFPPAIPNFEFTSPGGGAGSGYQISFTPDPGPGPNTGNPLATVGTITTGNWEGLQGLITPYIITVTAQSETGNSEVRLRRELQTVAVPVFQFGIFGQNDLGFHAGPSFDFGGRVHTNASLFVSQGTGNTLTFRDKITAFTQVVRDRLMNGALITTTNHTGTVRVPTVIPSTWRNLASSESSGTIQTPCVGSATTDSNCWTGWKNLSEVTYATNIRTQATGAKQLQLPIAQQGGTAIDLVRRPAVSSNEDTANPVVYAQRYFSQASLRILLSDRAADITNLPTVTATPPVDLAAFRNMAMGYAPSAGNLPAGLSQGEVETGDLPGQPAIFTRVSAISGSTLTIQTATNAAFSTGLVTDVPAWLKWSEIRIGAGSHGGGGTVLACRGMNGTQMLACNTSTGAGHPSGGYPINTQVQVRRPDNWPINLTTTTAAANGTSVTIGFNGMPNNSLVNQFNATKTFFVGEDPVTCTVFGANGNELQNCGWGGGSVSANDPVYLGPTVDHDTPYLHGFLKIERQDAAGTWTDVTTELLNLGFTGRNQDGQICNDPSPNAVIRLQRLRDNGLLTACTLAANDYSGLFANPHDFWPNTIFDAREASTRLLGTGDGPHVGGIFSYVALDVNNYRRWLAGEIGTTGNQSLNNNGFIVYFSDRRGNHDTTQPNEPETGEYGFEDSLNPTASAWNRDLTLNDGEDVNQNSLLERYGEIPWAGDAAAPGYIGTGAVVPFNSSASSSPWEQIALNRSGRGRLARVVLFRRALKIINGGMVGAVNNVPAAGFTVASENPVFVQGNFNATTTSATAEPNVATSIVADTVTLLSNSFVDGSTFRWPNNMTNRNATETSYRFAMITGKALPFAYPGWGVTEWGSDGGVHNFMRMLEDWGGQTLRYRGSMVSLWFSRQATGPYRADANVYAPPSRGYNFDVDFLTPALLPPGTPAFRDINTLKFRQILRPNQ
jgi:hypothetical protein